MTTQITFKRGDTYSRVVFLNIANTGVDITGYTFFFTVKKCIDNVKDDSSALIKKDITTFSDPTNGRFVLELSPEDTDIPEGEYYYDFEYKKPDNSIHTITESPICIVKGDVTRRTE